MAKKKHRKLFPMLASKKNKTLDCSIGICDSICPYNCYQEPDYYTISPQLTPWSSPQPIRAPSPSISAVNQPSQNPSSSIDAITIITVTGAVLAILLTGLFLVAKYVTASVNRVNHGGRYQSERDGDDDDTVDEEFRDREQVDHPIWLIRTTGLQQSIINSITICNYKRGDGLIERTDCPVCLSEFEEDESLRLLPNCNHAFHISCIDTWLRSHTNCPLCRAGIAISAATPRCSGPVEASRRPRVSGSRLVNDGVGEHLDRGQIENRGDLERESGESGFKERLSSSYRDSEYSDVRIEINEIVNESNRNSKERDGDGSETETKEQVWVLRDCLDSNGRDFNDSLSQTKTHIENVDFPGKSCENQIQGVNRRETEKENRPIGDEASCSEENSGHNVESLTSSDSNKSNGEATEVIEKIQSDISSKTIGSSASTKTKVRFFRYK